MKRTFFIVCLLVAFKTVNAGFLFRANEKSRHTLPSQLQSLRDDSLRVNTKCANLQYQQNNRIFHSTTMHRGGGIMRTAMPRLQADKKLETAIEQNSQYYYLLNSLSTWKSILINTLILILARRLIVSSYITMPQFLCNLSCGPQLQHKKGLEHIWRISLPLLSSSCCAVQLFLNAIAGAGCAGFNTVLGPLRPLFVSMLLFTTLNSFSTYGGKQIFQLVLSWAVALMPEFIHYLNQKLAKKEMVQSKEDSLSASGLLETETIEFDIKGMGCVACINKIDGTLRSLNNNIIEASSWLNSEEKGGKARVSIQYNDKAKRDSLVREIISSVKDAGFDCKLQAGK